MQRKKAVEIQRYVVDDIFWKACVFILLVEVILIIFHQLLLREFPAAALIVLGILVLYS